MTNCRLKLKTLNLKVFDSAQTDIAENETIVLDLSH